MTKNIYRGWSCEYQDDGWLMMYSRMREVLRFGKWPVNGHWEDAGPGRPQGLRGKRIAPGRAQVLGGSQGSILMTL